MNGGYAGKIAFINLSTGEIEEEVLDENLARGFIGGYGLGARILFERQKAGIDPLGPENIVGFTTGPLTGTKTPTGGRYMAVCKSPLTGGWGDANSGGYFGSELKSAGWDAIFFLGKASSPAYVMVTNDRLELRDASHLWGKDTIETEHILSQELGTKIRVACIGPASEKLSLISGISNDMGRFAARSGVGAVMGAKKLKAVVVHGEGRTPVANGVQLDELRRAFMKELRESMGPHKILMEYGTCGNTKGLLTAGAAPVKNWSLAGFENFPTADKISEGEAVIKYQLRKYGCANCPVACGGIASVQEGPYPLTESHKPEYETIVALGSMCLNDDLLSIFKLNDMCNRSGLDTISAGSVLAFAMECYEKGILTKADTDGIELTWGNARGMISLIEKIIRREGIGDILADGVKVAASKIGKGADQWAVHVGGQEPGFHNPLFSPSRAIGYVCDPTPGRHTQGAMARLDFRTAIIAPYPELQFDQFDRYEYKKKGSPSATISCYWQVGQCAGVCLFPVIFFGFFPLIDFLNAVTGWDMDINEALNAGARIQTLRLCFNLREGIKPSAIKLPDRLAGIPPQTNGPVAGITIDVDSLTSEYRKAMGWHPETGLPEASAMERLGLKSLVENQGGLWER